MEIFKDFETGSAVDMGSNPILTIDIKAYGYWQWQLVGPRWPVSFITLQQVQGYLHDYSFFTRPLSMSVFLRWKRLRQWRRIQGAWWRHRGCLPRVPKNHAPPLVYGFPCYSSPFTYPQIEFLLINFNPIQSKSIFISKFPIYLLRKWMKRKNLIKPKRFRISQLKFPHFSENGLINMR